MPRDRNNAQIGNGELKLIKKQNVKNVVCMCITLLELKIAELKKYLKFVSYVAFILGIEICLWRND